jgi:hypothetical protein
MKCDLTHCPEVATYALDLGRKPPEMLCTKHYLSFKAHIEAKRPGCKLVAYDYGGDTVH